MDDRLVTITQEEYQYLLKRAAELEFALDMSNLHGGDLDEVLEQFVYEEDE